MSKHTPFEKFEQKPVFITGFSKSGTTLLLSLLDFHPELVVLPEESRFFSHILPAKDKLKASFEECSLKVLGLGKFCWSSGFRDYRDINFNRFSTVLKQEIEKARNNKEVLLALVKAFYEVEKSDKRNKKRWVEKTPSSEYFFPLMRRWFKDDLICLHIIRNPLDNFASYRNRKRHANLPIKKFCADWLFSRELAKLAERKIKGFHIIKYEALVKEPEKHLRKICAWLNIKFQPSMLQPTRHGKLWPGNSSLGYQFKAISQKAVGRYKQALADQEIKKINKFVNGHHFWLNLEIKKRILAFKLKWLFPPAAIALLKIKRLELKPRLKRKLCRTFPKSCRLYKSLFRR